MKRALLLLAVLVIVASGVAVFYLASSLDALVKDGIETYGSRMTGTAVRVGSVDISLREGRGTLRNLRIANPEGFAERDALRLGELTLSLDLRSLAQEPYVLTLLRIHEPEVNAEIDASGRTNIDALRKRVSAYSGSKPAAEQSGEPPPRLRIAQLEFEGGVASADTRALGGDERRVELPPLRLSNLGGAGGETADRVAKTVLEAYAKTVARAVTSALASSSAEKLLEKELGAEAGKAARDLLRNLLD